MSDIYNDNQVDDGYVINQRARDLGRYNDPEGLNVKWARSILQNPIAVAIVNGLHLWKGSKCNGYAVINSKKLPYRPEDDDGVQIRVHRLMYELLVRHVSVYASVCHRSRIKHCISPHDLFEGTHAENSNHEIIMGRTYPKGEDHWASRVSTNDIKRMVHMYYSNALPVYKIAERFNITPQWTSRLVHGHVRQEETHIAREEALSNL